MLVTYFVNDHLFGKELLILFAASAFRKLSSIYVFSYFPIGFEGRIWDLIVSVPDHCLSFYFSCSWMTPYLTGSCWIAEIIGCRPRPHTSQCNFQYFPDVSEFYTEKEQNTNNQSEYTSLPTTARDPSTYCKSQNIIYVQPNNVWQLSTYLSKSERWLQSQPGSPNVIGRFIDVNPSIWWCIVVINKELQI